MIQGLALQKEERLSMEAIAPGVAGLRIGFVNVFGVAEPDGAGWTLVDAGLYFSAGRIRRWAAEQFGSRRPKAILVTHGHFDHVGSLSALAENWDVPIYAHPLEAPYLTGRSKYPPPDPSVGGGGMAALSFLYPRGPIDISSRLRPLPHDGSVPGLDGWRWIHTPGHTPGHVSFFREADRLLVAGDAFVTTRQESVLAVAAQRPELHGPPAYYTSDWDAARRSVEELAALAPAIVACGHGFPMAGPDVAQSLQRLANRFDELARPSHGRYVVRPALADERGVYETPPRAGSALRTGLLVAGTAGAAAALWYAARRRNGALRNGALRNGA